MRLLSFELNDWRNISSCRVEPGRGINVLFGDNAQGKTNLIEGIYYVATLRTFRPGRLGQLARWETGGFRLRARAEVEGRVVQFEVQQQSAQRTLRVDGGPVPTTDEYFGGFNVVLFTPEHLALVRGEPAGRRTYVDRALFNVEASQLPVVRRYNRVLRERNAFLRQATVVDKNLLDALDQQLAHAGSTLVFRRRWLLEELGPLLGEVHRRLTGGGKQLELRYRSRGLGDEQDVQSEVDQLGEQALAARLWEALREKRGEDLRRGFTTVGPHQDDVAVLLEGRPARLVASQGETRTIVLAMKLAEVLWIHDRRTEPPVLLLDDIGSELDETRRRVLFDYIYRMDCQTFLTTVAPDSVTEGENRVYYHIVDGVVTPQK
ncbi:MAG: DNA replication/repair protein RecF [bacterium]